MIRNAQNGFKLPPSPTRTRPLLKFSSMTIRQKSQIFHVENDRTLRILQTDHLVQNRAIKGEFRLISTISPREGNRKKISEREKREGKEGKKEEKALDRG